MDIKEIIEVDPEKMSGTAVFTGTRVPINHLFDYLEIRPPKFNTTSPEI